MVLYLVCQGAALWESEKSSKLIITIEIERAPRGNREGRRRRRRELSFVFCMWEIVNRLLLQNECGKIINFELDSLAPGTVVQTLSFLPDFNSALLMQSQQLQCICSSYNCRSYNSLYSPWIWVHCMWFNMTVHWKLYWQTVTKLNYSPDPIPIN